MRSSLYLTTLALISSVRAAADVHLAVSPKCGSLSGVVADVNAGLRDLRSYTTHVTFGVSLLLITERWLLIPAFTGLVLHLSGSRDPVEWSILGRVPCQQLERKVAQLCCELFNEQDDVCLMAEQGQRCGCRRDCVRGFQPQSGLLYPEYAVERRCFFELHLTRCTVGNFIQQASTNPSLNPDTTLYSVFFGIE